MSLLLWVVLSIQPFHNIETVWSVQGNGIFVEEVWGQDEIAIGSKLICDQLGIDETMANDIGDAIGEQSV